MTTKALYKIGLYYLKLIPVLLAGVTFLNTFLSYHGIDLPILSYIGGISILSLLFLYIASYMFKFCNWHRMFLHYVFINWVINIVDYHVGIPISDKSMFLLYIIITSMFLFGIAYLKFR